MNVFHRAILGATLVAGVASSVPMLKAQAQTTHSDSAPGVEFALTYTAQRSNTTGGHAFWMQGGNAQIAGTIYRGLGVVADVTATRASKINASNVDLTLVTTTFGPRYTWTLPARTAHPIRMFGEMTGGIVNGLDSAFPSQQGVQSNLNGTAIQFGGGVNLTVSRHFALRVMQAHWVRTWLPNAYSGAQNNFTTGAGIVFRLPR